MTRLRRYAREVARTWRAYTRTPRHRAPVVRGTRAESLRDRVWAEHIHDWAERRRAHYANAGSST